VVPQKFHPNLEHCVPVGQPLRTWSAANQEWALDFVHDEVDCGRTIRVLSVVDAYTRLEVDTSLASRRVTRVLDAIRGRARAALGDPFHAPRQKMPTGEFGPIPQRIQALLALEVETGKTATAAQRSRAHCSDSARGPELGTSTRRLGTI